MENGTLITYKIFSDEEDKLKSAVKVACSFWNRFIIPKNSIVIGMGTFTSKGFVIARAYKPYFYDDTTFGAVEFNTKYLNEFSGFDIAGTIIHEIAHTLGIGWVKWEDLFNRPDGSFTKESIQEISELQYMWVETDYGSGTQYSHWDEERFDKELMTGLKNGSEYVLPVTIKVMRLLGHKVIECLVEKTDLSILLGKASYVTFSKQKEAQKLNLSYFKETELMEEFYS